MHAGADISTMKDTRLWVSELRDNLNTALTQATLDAVKPPPTVPAQLGDTGASLCVTCVLPSEPWLAVGDVGLFQSALLMLTCCLRSCKHLLGALQGLLIT
jgi:hypothetical protein